MKNLGQKTRSYEPSKKVGKRRDIGRKGKKGLTQRKEKRKEGILRKKTKREPSRGRERRRKGKG